MKISDWNNLRARLHHDWLQNRYLTFLMARAEYLDNAIVEKEQVRADIIEQFIDWQNQKEDFEALINDTKDALSPAQIIDEYPLNRMSEENKAWLKEVVHALYLERTGIKGTAKKLKKNLNTISEFHALLSKIIKGENNGLRQKAGNRPFERFHKEVQEFSKMISSLPHEVQVV